MKKKYLSPKVKSLDVEIEHFLLEVSNINGPGYDDTGEGTDLGDDENNA